MVPALVLPVPCILLMTVCLRSIYFSVYCIVFDICLVVYLREFQVRSRVFTVRVYRSRTRSPCPFRFQLWAACKTAQDAVLLRDSLPAPGEAMGPDLAAGIELLVTARVKALAVPAG